MTLLTDTPYKRWFDGRLDAGEPLDTIWQMILIKVQLQILVARQCMNEDRPERPVAPETAPLQDTQ